MIRCTCHFFQLQSSPTIWELGQWWGVSPKSAWHAQTEENCEDYAGEGSMLWTLTCSLNHIEPLPETHLTRPSLSCPAQGTILAILDCMKERVEGEREAYLVHYRILDSDHNGRAPTSKSFNNSHKSCLQKIAKSGNKVCMHYRARDVYVCYCIHTYIHTYVAHTHKHQ